MSIPKPQNIPATPGIYIFWNGKKPIYIGKAANLKKRLNYYFRKKIGDKTKKLLSETTKLAWIETDSDIDALIAESNLIKKYHPQYNILMKDDKNYFFVGITGEFFPKIFVTHQPTKAQKLKLKTKNQNLKFKTYHIGPFTSGTSLKIVLKLLRRFFPYCTCRKPHKRPCLNSQIGRCMGFCCNKTQSTDSKLQKEYSASTKKVVSILRGRGSKLLIDLKKEMRHLAKNQDFEKAAKIRDQIYGLENILKHRIFHYRGETSIVSSWTKIEKNLREILKTDKKISRVEGYDISNISGSAATGSMAVFIDGRPAKSEYRKFRIKTVRQISDVDMLREVVKRRLKHPEWNFPDLILVDGGKAQLNATLQELRTKNSEIRIAALAKKEEELYLENRKKTIRLYSLPKPTSFFLQRIRNEAHRFAKKYHHKLREMEPHAQAHGT